MREFAAEQGFMHWYEQQLLRFQESEGRKRCFLRNEDPAETRDQGTSSSDEQQEAMSDEVTLWKK